MSVWFGLCHALHTPQKNQTNKTKQTNKKRDQTEVDAKVIGSSPEKDVAVLRLVVPPGGKLPPLRPLALGSSSHLMVGQRVFAIGNPFGERSCVCEKQCVRSL